MAIIVVRGHRKQVNHKLMMLAFEQAPTLIVDCANVANAHAYFPYVPEEKFSAVYVMIVEAIYRLRDSIQHIPSFRLPIKTVVITTHDRLFHYDNPDEVTQVILHACELANTLPYQVYIGVTKHIPLGGLTIWDIPTGVIEQPQK